MVKMMAMWILLPSKKELGLDLSLNCFLSADYGRAVKPKQVNKNREQEVLLF